MLNPPVVDSSCKPNWLRSLALAVSFTSFGMIPNVCPAQVILIAPHLNEQVVMVAARAHGGAAPAPIKLETTIFKPPGIGPFPVLIMNHGKALGDPHSQKRERSIVISREFVKRGYAVVIPMRKGFSKSSGDYREGLCDMTANGQTQAEDLQTTIEYLHTQQWADADRILVGGQSHGGLTTMAFGTRNTPGVRGLINFAGGLRVYGGDCEWRKSLVDAFASYGRKTATPSLWFYGENDSHFDPAMASRMYQAYVNSGGGGARMVAYGAFKKDAHSLSGSREGVKIWWPETERFLKEIGLPTEQVVAISDDIKFARTDFALIDNITAIPYLEESGREQYRVFLGKPLPRAFAVSSSGAWSWAEDGDDPAAYVLEHCQSKSKQPCKLYAVDNDVVWAQQSEVTASINK